MKASLWIRQASFFDLRQIQQVQARSLRELSAQHYSVEQIESLVISQALSYLNLLPLVSTPVYVAVTRDTHNKEKIIGAGFLSAGFSSIDGLYVHPKFSRRGVGTQLLRHLESIACQYHRSLFVTSSMVAVPFYQKAGYSIEHSYQIQSEGHLIDCEFMAKAFDKPTD